MFVVKTQILENYGAHSANGKFANGNAYWKMKGGNEYIVNDVERPQDAMAFIAAKYMTNDLYYKEFPLEVNYMEGMAKRVNECWTKNIVLF